MAFFNKQFINALFLATNTGSDRGVIAFVVPKGIDTPDGIELQEALSSTVYRGTFVFSASPLPVNDKDAAETFVQKVYDELAQEGFDRAFIWWPPPTSTLPVSLMAINANGTSLNSGLKAMLAEGLFFNVGNGMDLSWRDGNILYFNGNNSYKFEFSGPAKPATSATYTGTLPFTGIDRGCIQFTIFIQRQSLLDQWKWGFQYQVPAPSGGLVDTSTNWQPLASSASGGSDMIGFIVSIDPSDVYNEAFDPCPINGPCSISQSYEARRTYFNFTGVNQSGAFTMLSTFYQTTFGASVQLQPQGLGVGVLPARLVLSRGAFVASSQQSFLVVPEGDFTISLPDTTNPQNYYLMGGLQGTEFFIVTPQSGQTHGDTLRFLSRRPAYAAGFPFPESSPVGPPQDPTAPVLTGVYTTAFATFIPTSGNKILYVAQPKGAALFGKDVLIAPKFTDLFGHEIPTFNVTPNDTVTFPLLPYLAAVNGDGETTFTSYQIETFESQVLMPLRRAAVAQLSEGSIVPPEKPVNGDTKNSTTPAGLITKITKGTNGEMKWNEVLLGKNTDIIDGKEVTFEMKFVNPNAALVTALQSGDLFLVVANADNLGAFNSSNNNISSFYNTMSIGNWKTEANVGQTNLYGDYRNVMIIKGRRGKLFDKADVANSLVANSQKWTQAETFAAPTTLDQDGNLQKPDPTQLVILSQWLQTYFLDASKQTDNQYFRTFNKIALDENWTGILFLRLDLADVPRNLQGIMAGVTTPEAFNAHHLGISISPVVKGTDGGAALNNSSSIFGLIYYVDPEYTDVLPPQPIAPAQPEVYDFRLLTLKVLFENTTVSSFESLAQLTLSQLFRMPVARMGDGGNIFNNVLLKGSLQITNDQTLYSLETQGSNTFYFNSNVINKIQLSSVQLTTRNPDKNNNFVSWFAMTGFIDFFELQDTSKTAPTPFDIFSFGNEQGKDDPNMGLRFSNLGINMTFPTANPFAGKVLTFDSSAISFDVARSTPRKNSLFINFALDLQGLISADAGTTLQDSGYLNVISDLRLSEPVDSGWYGLRYKLNMGTAGELANKLNLESFMLTSWGINSSGTSYSAAVGMSLPGTGGGAKLISLQSVLKLSIGQIRLAYDVEHHSFILMFTEIALKFLGLLKIPPSGSTLFYLFGNPSSGGKASGLGWYAMYRIAKPA